jgi:hypothetical protein
MVLTVPALSSLARIAFVHLVYFAAMVASGLDFHAENPWRQAAFNKKPFAGRLKIIKIPLNFIITHFIFFLQQRYVRLVPFRLIAQT